MLSLLLFVVFLSGCAGVRVEREVPSGERVLIYRAPVYGKILSKERGVFIVSRCGEFFRAVEGGRVLYAGRDVGSYGWVVILRQVDGNVSVYGKAKKLWVKGGERVKARQVLGRVGEERGRCGIYFEVRNARGEAVEFSLR